jgi:anti-anti-sigma factor
MPFELWSETVVLAELGDDPQFTDDMNAIIEHCGDNGRVDVLLDFAAISHLNSSNIAKLLKLRKLVTVSNQRRLKLCGINRHVWGVFLVTGLDKIFDFVDDVASGLASLQMGE